MVTECRNKSGTNRAVRFSNIACGLRLVPSNVFCPRGVDIVKGNMMIGPGSLVGRLTCLGSRNVGASGLHVSSHTRIVLPCRVRLSRLRRSSGNRGGVNAAVGNVKPTCVSGTTHINVQMTSLLSGRVFRRHLGVGLRRGGHRFAGVFSSMRVGFRSVFRRCCRCKRRVGGCIYSASIVLGSMLSTNGHILFRNTRKIVLSVSRNACPFIASSGPITNNMAVNDNINPAGVSGIINIYGTCASHINSNPFPARLFSRMKGRVHRINHRCKAAANEPHHVN